MLVWLGDMDEFEVEGKRIEAGSRRYSSLREGAQYNSLLLADREKLVGLDIVERLLLPTGPADFELVNLSVRAESKVNAQITVRKVTAPASQLDYPRAAVD